MRSAGGGVTMSRLSRMTWIAVILFAATGCFSYRGPRGVQDRLEKSLGFELNRDMSIKLGPVSTRFLAAVSGDMGEDELGLRDLTSLGVVVFERGPGNGLTPQPIGPGDLGFPEYKTMLSTRDGDEQVLILVKPRDGSIRDMVLLSVDADEVVLARLTGHIDKLLAKALDDARAGGAHRAREAVPF